MALPELILPKKTALALYELTGEPRPDLALILVMADARAYRLEKIEAEIQRLRGQVWHELREYRPRFEADDTDEGRSWEVERDFLEWEGLVMSKESLESTLIA